MKVSLEEIFAIQYARLDQKKVKLVVGELEVDVLITNMLQSQRF